MLVVAEVITRIRLTNMTWQKSCFNNVGKNQHYSNLYFSVHNGDMIYSKIYFQSIYNSYSSQPFPTGIPVENLALQIITRVTTLPNLLRTVQSTILDARERLIHHVK